MAVQITIRNVPEEVRDEIAAKAARQRQSMQEFLRGELERIASKPSIDAWLEEVRDYGQLNSWYQSFLYTYNNIRPHMGINMLTPKEAISLYLKS